ncbi:MAG: helix-turn-helix domain-containing protein [Candidatus Baldrarchaeia archaeon]
MSEELITPKRACRMLGVSASTLRRWTYQGKIRYVKLPSGRLRYYKSDIERILRGESIAEDS